MTAPPSNEMFFAVSQPSDNAPVVCGARQMLAEMGFDETKSFLIATAVSELATNIIRYAETGTITLRDVDGGDRRAFVVIAKDLGPGIADIKKALQEHYSSGQGLGLGLSSVKRIMDEFDIQSEPGKGTHITAIKWIDK